MLFDRKTIVRLIAYCIASILLVCSPVYAGDSDKAGSSEVEATENDRMPDDDSNDTDEWCLILVNKQNHIPEDYEPELTSINNSMMADKRLVTDLRRMFNAAQKDGISLWVCSAYRSYDRQTQLFNNKIKKCHSKGVSYLDAYAEASMSVTVPGASEHQLGLALDIVTSSYTSLNEGFGDTKAGRWLAKNAPDYGFILRYPKGKEDVTGIIYEPWHFRYVTTRYSKEITDLNVTLEEYLSDYYNRTEE